MPNEVAKPILNCEDCEEEMKPNERRRRCGRCGQLVCGWCFNHVHGSSCPGGVQQASPPQVDALTREELPESTDFKSLARMQLAEEGHYLYGSLVAERAWRLRAEADRLRLRKALEGLYNETAEYITINSLGDVHHNKSMQAARAARRGETEK